MKRWIRAAMEACRQRSRQTFPKNFSKVGLYPLSEEPRVGIKNQQYLYMAREARDLEATTKPTAQG